MADIKTNQSKVYNALKGMGYSGIGANEAEFASKMSNPKNRAKVYKALSERGYKGIGKDQAAFDTLIYQTPTQKQTPVQQPAQAEAQPQSAQPTQSATQPQAAPQQKPAEPYKPSDLEMMGFGMTIGNAQGALDSSKKSLDKTIQNLKTYQRQQAVTGGVAKTEPKWNPETGEMEETYLTSAGTEHKDRQEAADVQRKLNDAYWREAHPLEAAEREIGQDLRDIRTEEERLTEQRRAAEGNKRPEDKTWWDYFKENFGASAVSGISPMGTNVDRDMIEAEMTRKGSYGTERQGIQREQDVLLARRRLAEDARQLLSDVRKDRQEYGFFGGMARAGEKVLETALNPHTWDFGEADLKSQLAVADAVIKSDSGLGISSNEQKLLDTWAKNAAINSKFGDQLSGWTKAGIVTGESLPFMLEMAMNPASGLGEAATAQLMKYSLKKYGTKWVKDHAKSMLAKKIATRLIGDVVGAGIMSTTTGIARVAADYENRVTGQVDIAMDANGDVIYNGIKQDTKENPGAALFKALSSTSIENWSEMAGNYLGFVNSFFGKALAKTAIGKAGRRMLAETGSIEGVSLNKAQKFIYELAAGKGIGAFSQGLKQFADRTQWHGVIGEYLEEEIGNIANALVVGDMTLDTAENTGVFNLQQNIDTFCGVALMGGFMSALNTVGYAAHRYNYDLDRVSNANAKIFGDELWSRIRTTIDSSIGDPRGLNDTLTDLIGGDETAFDKDGKKAILKYAQAALEKQGAEMSQYQPRMASTEREEVSGENGKQWVVTSVDKNGEAISQQAFDTEDEAIAFEGELKMRQQQQDYNDYLSMTNKLSYPEAAQAVDEFIRGLGDGFDYAEAVAAINDPKSELGKQFMQFKTEKILQKAEANRAAIETFEEENGWTPGTVAWLAEQDPMQLDAEGLQMADQARAFLEGLAYPAGEVHVEHEQQVGAETAQAVVENVISPEVLIDANDNAGQQLLDNFKASVDAMTQLFDRNEELKEEFYRLQGMGLSAQEIISSLDSFRPEEVQTIIDYFNANARYLSFMDEASKQIDNAARRSRDSHTMKGTINGNADLSNVYTITDGTNTYYLVSGNITTDPTTGQITDSDSGLIIGMDLDGSFVNIGDASGYSVMPTTQSLDQFEEQERIRLQEQITAAVDPNGTMGAEQPQEVQQGGNVGGEAGASTGTGADEAPTPAPANPVQPVNPPLPAGGQVESQQPTEPQQPATPTIESVTGEDGVKRYELGISVDDAIADIEADGLDVNAEADLAINEAQEELGKIGEPKTRAERVKNDARRKELQNTIDYYNNVKQRYGELHPQYADAQPFIDQLNAATSKRKADEILNEALQAGVNPAEIQQVHTQKVSDLITKEEEARRQAEEITDKDRRDVLEKGGTPEGRAWLLDRKRIPSYSKRIKLAKLIYGDYFDDDFDAWRDIRELISSWLGKGRNLDPDTFGQELGWDMGVGKDAAKVSTMFAARRQNGGDGMTFNEFVHMVMENSGGRFTTEDIRNELIAMFQEAQEKYDLTEYQLLSRVAEAENTIADEMRRAEEGAEDSEQPVEGTIIDGQLPFPPADDDSDQAQREDGQLLIQTSKREAAAGLSTLPSGSSAGKDNENPDTNQGNEGKTSSREEYLASHPLTEEQIMADTEATEDEKLNAIDFLRGEDDSAISRFYYDSIYERAQLQKPIETEDPIEAIEQAASSFREGQKKEEKASEKERDEQKSQDQQDIDDALKEFNDFLDNAKGSNVLDKFMRKGLEGNDKAQANLLDAFTLTNEAQRMFLKDLLRLASKVGYAYIKSGIHDAQAWSMKMSESIGAKLKEVLGWDDTIISEFADEVWNQKYTVDGVRMRLSEHAERLKKNKPADNSVNVNKTENNEPENVVSSQQKPASELEGDSAKFAEREQKIAKLRKDIHKKLKDLVMWGDKPLPLSFYKGLAKDAGLSLISDTDLQELIEAEVVDYAREIANDNALFDKQRFDYIVRLYNAQPSLNARDNDRINLQQYSTPAPMAFLMGKFLKKGKKVESGLEPSAGNGMLTINLPKEAMHVNDIDEMRLSNLAKQGFGEVTSQDGTQPFGEKKYDVVVTNPPFGNVPSKTYDGLYEISGLEHQMAINALESMKDDGRAAIIIGGNTEYNQNGSIKGKDRAFFNYLYAHYNVVDVINMNGHELYSRQGTGFPVRMILINGRKEFNPRSFAPTIQKARAERVNSYDELYKRVNDDILSDSNKPASVHNTESGEGNGGTRTGDAGTSSETGVRNVRSEGGSKQRQLLDSGGQSVSGGVGSTSKGADTGTDTSVGERGDVVHGAGSTASQPSGSATASTEQGGNVPNRRDGAERPDGRVDVPVGTGQRGTGTAQQTEQPSVKRGLGTEKVPYRKQSGNPFTLQSLMPAEQADVVKKSLEDLGDVDQYLVDELGYSSKEELHQALAAEQIDSVAMAIHQMNQGNAFIIGDQTGIGKGRQAAALIRYGVKKGGFPVFITVKKGLFSDMYRDLCDIGSPDLRPFIWSADDTEHSADVTDKDGNVVHKRPSDKEQKRVVDYINKYGKLPPEYDYIITTYDSFKGGTMVYEEGQKKPRSFGKKQPTTGAYNSQAKRDALEVLSQNSFVIMDESHNAGGEGSAVSGYLQYITAKAKGVTFLSATFAKRPGNMPIYSLKTAIAKAGVKVGELIDAVKRGGATFQEIMSKALTEAGQMIRRERDMTGVTIDWKGIEDEAVIQKQREQYDTIIGLFNDIIDFQRRYVDPIVNKKNDEAADEQGEVDHTPGTRDMGINNTPFASRTYNMVQQVLLSLKAEETAKRAIEHLKQGHKPVIALANTNEGAADEVSTGEDMEMPDLSVNLKKGLQGTLRITKKDAFGNSTNEMIPFDELSEAGQARYREIMDAIENASSGLSLSPIDVIKNELKKAGYKVGELTGRKQEFVYNEDGTVKRVKRQDSDKKRTAADFNNGKLDVLILNKSAGTGISLHASSKFGDQRQRVMIVAQAQGDVNDEVQIRGRIDRTGQVLRGMYEYVVSQIPSEQRLLMMLKAKLRSLDANTTSSQKSKFNEMQVQDIINKYGDDIVIQYLAEHPDLAVKMVDPLKWNNKLGEGWDSAPSETLIANAEKDGEAGKTASKVLGRMALLKVAEQEKMLAEIGELYQAEIDRLNEMGENDLEIAEMPLRAKTLKKDVWEEGVEPGGNNPFADNSYVEEVEMDVLRKPMKAEEVKKSQARLLGGKTWDEYKQGVIEKVNAWADQKKEETRKTITERAEKKANTEKEKYAKGAKKAQEKNGMTDAEIEKNAGYQYDTFYNQEMGKLDSALEAIDKQAQAFIDAVETFSTDGVYALPTDIYDLGQLTFEPSFGKVIDIKITDNFSTTASTISFATLDGRRKITIPISGMVKQNNGEKADIKPTIVSQTAQARSGFFGSNIANTLKVLEQNVDNWDKLTSTATRKKGYIITGNLLKALTSLRSQGKGGKLISYTTDTGEIRQGILMSDQFDPGSLTSKNPISSAKADLDDWNKDRKIVSADKEVTISYGNWASYSLKVPKSKKRGEKYFNDEVLLSLMDGQFEGSSAMKADFKAENLDAVLKRLDELGVTVESAKEDSDAPKRMITTSDPMEAINQAAESWRQSNGKTPTNSKLQEISDMVDSLASREDLKGSAPTYTINSRQDLEAMKGKVSSRVYREIERLYADPDNGAAYIPRAGIVVVFGEHLEDAKEAEAAWWHEQTHSFWQKLPENERRKFGYACFDWLRKNRPDIYNHITKPGNYERYDWLNEACAFLIGNVAIESNGTEKFLNGNFVGNPEICNFANELRKHIRNGRQGSTNTGNNQLRRIGEGEQTPGTQVRGSSQQGQKRGDNIVRPEEESELPEDPLEAIEQSAKLWRRERRDRENGENTPLQQSAKAIYNERLNRVETVFSEAYQDAMVSLKTAQNAIAHDKEIPDSQNAYMAENLMHGKTKNEQDLFNIEHRDPIIRTINKIMNLTGMNWGDIDRYVYTKSGLERNREFFVRDWLENERRKSIRSYEDLNPEEQEIYDRKAETIETLFEDGDIETEEQKQKELEKALKEAHREYIDSIEDEYLRVKRMRYEDLQAGDSIELGMDSFTFVDYLNEIDSFIRKNIDAGYKPAKHDYSGLRAMYGDENGKYDEDDIIAELMNTEDAIEADNVDTLWEQIQGATRYGLERYREAGMRSDEQIDRVEQMFHWYVPMRGFKEDMGEDMYQYFTQKGTAKSYIGGLLKHAKGRGSEAEYPISTIFAMSYKAIADCNQNMVNQKLYRLCQANPNDLVILSDSWAKLNETTGEWEETGPDIPEEASEEEVREATLAWEDEMRQLALENKAKKIKGREKFDYKPMDKEKKNEHIIDVRINGQPRKMIVISNPRMAQALNGQLRFEHGKNVFSKWNAAIKNFMASVFTSYSPTFAMRNMFRDWTHFRMMLGVREGQGYASRASKYYRKSLFKMVGLFKKYRNGTLDESNEMERDFKDFMDNGGVTGFVFMQKVDDIQKEMEDIYKKQKAGKTIRLNNNLWEKILGAIEAVNEGIENNARFATYRASRHYAGRTKARSAYDAKEITVNFNRKGAGSKTAGFKSQSKTVKDAAKAFGITSQVFGEGRIFFNATVQAIATTFKNFQKPDGSLNKSYIAKWTAMYALPPFMFGLALPMINKALANAFGGDDDDDPYANLPEWTRRKNLCFYIGHGNFITIPVGQELAAFLTLGDIFAGMTYAPDLKPVDKSWDDEIVGVMNTFSPVDVDTKITKGGLKEDPLDETIGRTFSVLAPLVAVQQNLGWTGRPIYREDVYPSDKYSPEYQMVYNGTNPVLVNASKLANDLSGGDSVARGKIQVNPAIVQYLWEQYTGGPGKLFSNTISIGKDAKDILVGNDNDFNIRKVEGLKAFVQQGDDRTQYYRTQAKYRKYKADADELSNMVNGYQQAAATDPMALPRLERISMSEDFVRMQIVKEAEKTLSQINKAANKAEGKERKELRRLYNQQVKAVVDMLDEVGE